MRFLASIYPRATANKFAHLSGNDFASIYLMKTNVNDASNASNYSLPTIRTTVAGRRKLKGQYRYGSSKPMLVNWVTAGYSTAIKNQGACGEWTKRTAKL